MRRYQKWLTVGLLALTTPGMVFAGSGTTKKEPVVRAQSARQSANQEVANRVKEALESSRVSMQEVEIMVQNGTAMVRGVVASPADRTEAEQVIRRVKGVTRVENQLQVAPPQRRPSAQRAAGGQDFRPVAYQDDVDGLIPPAPGGIPGGPASIPPAPGVGTAPLPPGAVYGNPGMMGVPGGMGAPVPGYENRAAMGAPAPMPSYAGPAYGPSGASSSAIYNQPGLPNYAWPTYAQYPNSAAVSYPSQYSASAFPYIGPFYPYPQVPLGWRKAQLEWDDGYWHLNFSPRTERWWWFLDWRNW